MTMMRNEGRLQSKQVRMVRFISLGAIAGPVLFLIAWLVLGLAQPAMKGEYGVIGGVQGTVTNPISALGVGPHAGLFNSAFIACGLLTLAGALATLHAVRPAEPTTTRGWSAVLLGLSPVGLTLAGFFTLAASLVMHNIAAILIFVVPIAAFPVSALYLRRAARWHRLRMCLFAGSPLTLGLLVLFVVNFHLSAVVAGTGIAGLTERLLISEIHACYVILGWSGFRG